MGKPWPKSISLMSRPRLLLVEDAAQIRRMRSAQSLLYAKPDPPARSQAEGPVKTHHLSLLTTTAGPLNLKLRSTKVNRDAKSPEETIAFSNRIPSESRRFYALRDRRRQSYTYVVPKTPSKECTCDVRPWWPHRRRRGGSGHLCGVYSFAATRH